MKSILDIEKQLKDEAYFSAQIAHSHKNCNVLFVSPYKTAMGVYKYMLPYILMQDDGIANCALTGLEKFDEQKQYVEIDIPLTSNQIQWADVIVFPFTTQALYSGQSHESVYHMIRKINPDIRIVYNVDFNFYLLDKNHTQQEMFTKNTVRNIEDNMFYADLTCCSNMLLVDYLQKKLAALKKTRYKDIDTNAQIMAYPLLIDEGIFMENVMQNDPQKLEPTKNDTLRIGIVASKNNHADIKPFGKYLLEAQKELGEEKLEIILMGDDGVDAKGKSILPKDLKFTHTKPCSVVHWMRQLDQLTLDALFIPLRFTEYNYTSENYNKLLEVALHKIPVITVNIFPYKEIIENGKNGIILEKQSDLAPLLKALTMKKSELATMGENAYNYVVTGLACHPENMILIKGILMGVDVNKYLHNMVEEKNLTEHKETLEKKVPMTEAQRKHAEAERQLAEANAKAAKLAEQQAKAKQVEDAKKHKQKTNGAPTKTAGKTKAAAGKTPSKKKTTPKPKTTEKPKTAPKKGGNTAKPKTEPKKGK